MRNIEDHFEPIYNNYHEAVTEYFNNKFEGIYKFANTAYHLLGFVCIGLILIIKLYRKLKDIYQGVENYFQNGHNPLNQKQNEGERRRGDGKALRDVHSGVATETSGHANNMLIDGRNIEVENCLGATISKDSGNANNMLIDGRNINIRNPGGGSGSNNSGCSNNMVIKDKNINRGDSVEASVGKNSISANNQVIKGENLNVEDYGSGSGRNNSSGVNNFLIKGSDMNLGGTVISKESDADFRFIIIPEEMVRKFRMKTNLSTDEQLETSAILLGKQSKNEFTVTHLLFLPQNENKNSCDTDIQNKLLAKQDELGLIGLGWISTHLPMDSIDFYTYFDNQQLMKEAIAIVVARDDDGIGIYELATLKFITNCRLSKIPVKNEKELLEKHLPHVKFDSVKVELMDLNKI